MILVRSKKQKILFQIGVGNYKFAISDFGQVGVNMRPNSFDFTNFLQVEGYVKAHGFDTWSDERLKENVNTYENALQKLLEKGKR